MSSALRMALVVVVVLGVIRGPVGAQARNEITITVPDVPGPYCVYGIEKRLREMPDVAGVRLLWEQDEIRVVPKEGADLTREQIEAAIERAEYPYAYSIEL